MSKNLQKLKELVELEKMDARKLRELGFVGFVAHPLGVPVETEVGFVGFVASISRNTQKSHASNDSTMVAALMASKGCEKRNHHGADNWSGSEIEAFNRRVVQFQNQGIDLPKAEAIAETLLVRDRDTDDRRMCVECLSLAKFNCTTPKAAGLTTRDVRPIRFMLQRCDGFKGRI